MRKLYPELESYIKNFDLSSISAERKSLIDPLLHYVNKQKALNQFVEINFICTHNSRRSQLCQVWAYVAASYFEIKGNFYSGGTEITSFNVNAVNVLKKAGFQIDNNKSDNPIYKISCGDRIAPLSTFSKLVEHKNNPSQGFAAVMTCSNAEENCPIVFGSSVRIKLTYEDPKIFDFSLKKEQKYEERSIQIGTEMFYLFSKVGI